MESQLKNSLSTITDGNTKETIIKHVLEDKEFLKLKESPLVILTKLEKENLNYLFRSFEDNKIQMNLTSEPSRFDLSDDYLYYNEEDDYLTTFNVSGTYFQDVVIPSLDWDYTVEQIANFVDKELEIREKIHNKKKPTDYDLYKLLVNCVYGTN